jgi:hypothetical protein
VGLRDRIRRLERAARGSLGSFELETGKRYWYEPMEAGKALFLFGVDCGRADYVAERPEPPEIVEALVRAKDRRAAFETLYGDAIALWFPYELAPFFENGELVHRSIVVGGDPNEPVPDLSEP